MLCLEIRQMISPSYELLPSQHAVLPLITNQTENALQAYPITISKTSLPSNFLCLNTEMNPDNNNDDQSPNLQNDYVNDDELPLRIKGTRDSLLMQKDNHVIFVNVDGTPLDKGSKDYQKANKFPQYNDLTIGSPCDRHRQRGLNSFRPQGK